MPKRKTNKSKPELKKEVYMVKNERSMGFVFETGDTSMQIYAPDVDDFLRIMNNLMLCEKVRQTLGFEYEKSKGGGK